MLALAATQFDVLVTADKYIQYQQNLKALPIAIVVLATPDGRIRSFQQLELLQAGKEMKAGLGRVVYSPLIAARKNTGPTQDRFSALLGITTSELADLEQERKQPDGAVRTLITIALNHPEALVAVANQTQIALGP